MKHLRHQRCFLIVFEGGKEEEAAVDAESIGG